MKIRNNNDVMIGRDREMDLADAMDEMIALGWTLDTFDDDFDNCESNDWTVEEKETCRRLFMYLWEERQNKYLVITSWLHGDENVVLETDDLRDAKEIARLFAMTNPKDAHTFIVLQSEWEDGNYNEIEY